MDELVVKYSEQNICSQNVLFSLFIGPLMIIVEFAEHGNLLRHLRDRRKQNYEDMNEYSLDISSAERVRIACDVADGMKHLATMKVRQRCCFWKTFILSQPSPLYFFLSHASAKYMREPGNRCISLSRVVTFGAKLSEREEKTWVLVSFDSGQTS